MQIQNDVLAVLSAANVLGNAVELTGQLDRNLYTKTNKVLEAAGGKWSKKAKAHLFDGDAGARIEQIILTGSIDIPKDEFEFFPTPPNVVDRLLELSEIEPDMLLLEPSAGRAAIALACAERKEAQVHCIELMPANVAYLRELACFDVQEADFLQVPPNPVYDRVVMNPPFGKQADIKHVNHALKFLKPDGRLVAVMSAGVTFRENALTSDFRALVKSRGGSIEQLPEGSFKSSGTSVNTVIVII